MSAVAHDIRDALRAWRRAPMVTAAALVTLTLGLGANAAVFSLVNALYLRALPVGSPETFVRITGEEWFALGVWEHIRDHQSVFDGVTAVGAEHVLRRSAGSADRGTSASES